MSHVMRLTDIVFIRTIQAGRGQAMSQGVRVRVRVCVTKINPLDSPRDLVLCRLESKNAQKSHLHQYITSSQDLSLELGVQASRSGNPRGGRRSSSGFAGLERSFRTCLGVGCRLSGRAPRWHPAYASRSRRSVLHPDARRRRPVHPHPQSYPQVRTLSSHPSLRFIARLCLCSVWFASHSD
ncbi:hypothetical protein L227DRAFT_394845 [Lentinus tigrinus ALCF2SS1-6]|uniref:Uncharacterized protein n=1 Tax=Lentinus tigrinus ALCF2SS1-6 TaxID=1328759 RepID=A0A5C2SK01_9APHY|nr:hypothetical protein L227DRAFT_394845 [Lentinus tigrinus ALCF2SS1-6]